MYKIEMLDPKCNYKLFKRKYYETEESFEKWWNKHYEVWQHSYHLVGYKQFINEQKDIEWKVIRRTK